MLPGPYEKVPLTDDDIDFLNTIYRTRGRFLFSVYVILVPTGVMVAFRYNSIAGLVFLQAILLGSGFYLLNRRVLAFKRDIDSGMKEKVPFLIVDKEYFPMTNQYFFKLDDEQYDNHETDSDTYYSLNAGDKLYLCRGENSKFILEQTGRYTII